MTDHPRPMDGTGALIRRDRDGHPTETYFGGAEVHGGYWVQQVDAWPHGPLQAQLDRIEEKLDLLIKDHGPQAPYTRMPEQCGYHDWTGDWGRAACVKCGTPMEGWQRDD